MKLFGIVLLVILFLSGAPAGFCIDKGHFAGVSPEDFNTIVSAFGAIDVYYALNNGNSIITKYDQASGTQAPIKYALLLFFNPQAASGFFKTVKDLKLDPGKNEIKKYPVANMLGAIYSTLDQPLANSETDMPDMVILRDLMPVEMTFEYLAYEDSRKPYVLDIKGKPVIPAFLSTQAAKNMQANLAKQGQKLMRIGLDTKQFFAFIVQSRKNGKQVLLVDSYKK